MNKIPSKEILNKLNVFSLLGVTFLIPFNSDLNRYLLGIFLVSTFILYFNSLRSLKLKEYKGLIALSFLLIFYAISFIYSHN